MGDDYSGVIDIARNGVDEVIRLKRENAVLRCEIARLTDAMHAIVNHCEGTARRIASATIAASEGVPSKENGK